MAKREPPPMVPSASERVREKLRDVSACSGLIIPASAVQLVEQAYRDGWNAATDERDQINFDEGRAFERRAALAAQADDEARRRAIIEDAYKKAFGDKDDD